MIEINLLPEEMRKRNAVKISLPELPIKKTVFIAAGSLVALQLAATLLALGLSAYNGNLNREIVVLKEATRETIKMREKLSDLQLRSKELEGLTRRSLRWAGLLNALTHSMTKGVWLRSLKMEEISVEKTSAPSAAAKKGTEQKPAPAPKKGSKKTATKTAAVVEREQVQVMKLEGSVVAPGQETAFVGKFLKSLKDNPVFSKTFKDIRLSNMTQKRIMDREVHDMVILCTFDKEKAL